MKNDHIDYFTREMFAECLRDAREKSKDQRAEVILEVDGKLSVKQIQLKDFDWTEFQHIIAISFICETDDPEDYARHLYSPKNLAFQSSYGKQG